MCVMLATLRTSWATASVGVIVKASDVRLHQSARAFHCRSVSDRCVKVWNLLWELC